MTELDQCEAMFKRAGVVFDKNQDEEDGTTTLYFEGAAFGRGHANEGHHGAGWLVFDRAGMLLRVGASNN